MPSDIHSFLQGKAKVATPDPSSPYTIIESSMDDLSNEPAAHQDAAAQTATTTPTYQQHGKQSTEVEKDIDSEYDSDADSDVSDATAVIQERDGYFCVAHFESAYLKPRPKPKYYWCAPEVNYDSCSPRELKRFINDRGFKDPYPLGLTLKYFYIRILDGADKHKTFQFMDLPPEMRNMVYVELLTLPEGTCACHCICFPQILRTCKEVHREAADILYAVNPVDCGFSAYGDIDCIHRDAVIHKTSFEDPAVERFALMRSGLTAFPDFFRRIHHLRVFVNFDGDIDPEFDDGLEVEEKLEYLRRCLLGLASFLMDDHRLQKLEVVICNDIDGNPVDAGSTLYPLRRLRNIADVTVTGDVLEEEASEIEGDIESTEPAFNTLKHYQLLRKEAQAYQELDQYFSMPSKVALRKAASKPNDLENSKDIGRMCLGIDDFLESSGLCTKHCEKKAQQMIALLQEMLDKLRKAKFMKKVDRLAAASRARGRYQEKVRQARNPMAEVVTRQAAPFSPKL